MGEHWRQKMRRNGGIGALARVRNRLKRSEVEVVGRKKPKGMDVQRSNRRGEEEATPKRRKVQTWGSVSLGVVISSIT
ncbi:hypothetical protein SODALDRAFT_5151 [Sodiomyces alkalinus F11]|uniref:Uncharacterized protein n=1 Tax=Sodiomyces alkalinus (strain CBS 110278 / VKM F-3762 / F11) TaxID=1314773 RepID=A0A3N2Q5G3_SODAK|nr:hypothetical protein SODALDRAFT_5151 [Sodiomyces alkalinus F11]ROT42011.1 hypothetical protein SODALDRAFT_5151 [Sodiomyces alkalinus F11]